MGKRKQADRDDDDGPGPSDGPATIGQKTSFIKNKLVRSERYHKLKHEEKKKKKIERKKRQNEAAKAEELGLPPPPKAIPKVGRHFFPRLFSIKKLNCIHLQLKCRL